MESKMNDIQKHKNSFLINTLTSDIKFSTTREHPVSTLLNIVDPEFHEQAEHSF